MSSFDETMLNRLKKLEREVERLKLKQSPGAWLDWTPTVVGWAVGYTAITRYVSIGKLCHVYIYISGTSNATNAKVSLPLSVSGAPRFNYVAIPFITDASTVVHTGGRCFAQVRPSDEAPDPNYVWFWLDGSQVGWTDSGTKIIITSLSYEVA